MDELKRIIDFFRNKKNGDSEDNRKHSIVMLTIYSVFLLVVIIAVRTGSSSNTESSEVSNKDTSVKEEIQLEENKENKSHIIKNSDVNYSYMYTVTIDGEIETYIGKKIDDKEKFSYTKGDSIVEYAIKDDNYFILENGVYHITDKLNSYFKYCDIEKVLLLVDEIKPIVEENRFIFNVENSKISYMFGDVISNQNSGLNNIVINMNNDTIISADLDFSNYISSILGGNHSLIIKMEYANIGTTENFTIKLN